jgi:hypothetical protein
LSPRYRDRGAARKVKFKHSAVGSHQGKAHRIASKYGVGDQRLRHRCIVKGQGLGAQGKADDCPRHGCAYGKDRPKGGRVHPDQTTFLRNRTTLDHRTAPKEARDKLGLGPVINVLRGAQLFNPAVTHHGDAVRHGHRFFLIMGHGDEGQADIAVQPAQLDLQLPPEARIQRTKRFIEQQNTWFKDQRTGQCHALPLTA